MKMTKTKVLTVLLIIAVVIIAILCVKLLSKEDNNPVNQPEEVVVNNEQVEEKKEESVVEEKVVKGEKLLQFDTEFYDLEDVALEWRDSEKVKNYKDFNYDLDGDGVVDKVTMKWDKEDENRLILELNGEEFDSNCYQPAVYIVDLNENDKNIEVVTWDNGPSDDSCYNIYSKVNGKMELCDATVGFLIFDKNGIFLTPEDVFLDGMTNPQIYFKYTVIKDGKVEKKELNSVENINEIEFRVSGSSSVGYAVIAFSSAVENFDEFMRLYSDIDIHATLEELMKRANIEIMEEKISFRFLDFSKMYVQLSDGRKGYISWIGLAG